MAWWGKTNQGVRQLRNIRIKSCLTFSMTQWKANSPTYKRDNMYIHWIHNGGRLGRASARGHESEADEDRCKTFNMAINMFTAPVLLTGSDNPGASLERRKPAELRKADLLFWLWCRGASCKGLNLKAQFVGRYVYSQNLKCSVLLYSAWNTDPENHLPFFTMD